MGLKKAKLRSCMVNLCGFTGDSIASLGIIKLALTLGEAPLTTTIMQDFLVVDLPSAYNILLGRPALGLQHIVRSSTTHRTRGNGVGVVHGDQMLARDCYHIELQHRKGGHQLMTILVGENEKKEEDLDPRVRDERNLLKLIQKLEENQFAWSRGDMIGIDPKIIFHHSNVDPNYPVKRQKRRPQDFERQGALKQEVDKLLVSNFICEVFYPSWIANPVLVPKPNGTWRTCIDFSVLNKACLPLP
ncbi:uncharacterized protein LOC133030547 [Cannabis sativa]|uniref:uncharacterized protein LOC133030547 n=1 Tax=Cannabis sativa TaxID=3483 RepID=UPI0029CA2BC7|nr:uncharacterized protein LOC133030547 [Cannabis sativa]